MCVACQSFRNKEKPWNSARFLLIPAHFKTNCCTTGLMGNENCQDSNLPVTQLEQPQLLFDSFLNHNKITDTLLYCMHTYTVPVGSSTYTALTARSSPFHICLVSLWFSGLQEDPKYLQAENAKASLFMFCSSFKSATAVNKRQGSLYLCLWITVSTTLSVLQVRPRFLFQFLASNFWKRCSNSFHCCKTLLPKDLENTWIVSTTEYQNYIQLF